MLFYHIAAIVAIIASTVILYFKWKFTYWKKKNVYTPPPEIPFGNVRNQVLGKESLGQMVLSVYRELRRKGLRYGGYYIFTRPVFVAADFQLVRAILASDFQHFTDRVTYINEDADPLSGHLFSQTGAKWRALRIKLTPLFTSGKLKMMFQTLVATTKGLPVLLDEYEKKGEAFDIKDVFARYTTDVIASVGFGVECNSLADPDAEFRKYGKMIFEIGLVGRIKRLMHDWAPSAFKKLNVKINRQEIEDFFMGLVRQISEYRDKTNTERKDFMQLLLSLRHTALKVESHQPEDDKNSKSVGYYQDGLNMKEIAAQAFVFFIAGFETSSTTLNFLMYELAQRADIQEKLREEIEDVLARHNGEVTYEAVSELKYMEKCIYEAMRKYPALPVLFRKCTKTYHVPDSDLVLEKDTLAFISVLGIHYDPEYYPDPEKFDPERFSEEIKATRPPMTYLPFGEGPRNCIGLRLGMLQTKVGLLEMIRKFRFTLSSKTKTPLEIDPLQFILTAKDGVWVEAHRIKGSDTVIRG